MEREPRHADVRRVRDIPPVTECGMASRTLAWHAEPCRSIMCYKHKNIRYVHVVIPGGCP